MHVLLHGNRHPSVGGGVSKQLIARLERLLAEAETGEVDHIYFFAADDYPDGTKAADYVRTRLLAHGFSIDRFTIDPRAATTREEARMFVAHTPDHEPLGTATSRYHGPRSAFLLMQEGRTPHRIVTVTTGHWRDILLEPIKFLLERSGLGRRVKADIRQFHERVVGPRRTSGAP